MPELPEVETIRRGLEKRIVGKKITDLSFDWPKSFIGEKSTVVGARFLAVERRAKVLRVRLSDQKSLLFHLKMTGQLIYRQMADGSLQIANNTKQESGKQSAISDKQLAGSFAGGHPDHDWHAKLPNSNTRIIFTLDDGSRLFFNDMRKFGWCKVFDDQTLDVLLTTEYGPEPFDEKFNAEYLMRKASKIPNRNIKQFLTDQTIVAGIGNIYVDESLFDAHLLPTRKVKDILLSEWKQIVESVKKILTLGIEYGGTTDSDYVNADGEKGGMQDHLRVYRKTGQPCPSNCGGVIERTTLGGRGTHFCSSCQR